jgi:hypothetical protein
LNIVHREVYFLCTLMILHVVTYGLLIATTRHRSRLQNPPVHSVIAFKAHKAAYHIWDIFIAEIDRALQGMKGAELRAAYTSEVKKLKPD